MHDPKALKNAFDEYCDKMLTNEYSEIVISQMKDKMNRFYSECMKNYKSMETVVFKTSLIFDTFDKEEFKKILKSKEELKND